MGIDLSEAYAAQFMEEDLLFVCLQEGRRKCMCITAHGFIMVSGGCLNGNLGCEVWINTCIPYGTDPETGKELFMTKRNIHVITHTLRLLLIAISASGLKILVCSAHAPTTCAKLATKQQF